jgi:hypothetical protein
MMDLMYLSTLDLPGSLILESRTFSSSSSQVSWIYQHVLTLYTSNPRTYSPYTQTTRVHVCTLYTAIPRMYSPYTQPFSIRVLTLYTDNPRMPQKIGFYVNQIISPSTIHATLDVRHFRCNHKYLQEDLHKKIDIQYVQVCFYE